MDQKLKMKNFLVGKIVLPATIAHQPSHEHLESSKSHSPNRQKYFFERKSTFFMSSKKFLKVPL